MERAVQRWVVNISAWNPSIAEFNFCLSLLPENEHSAITGFVKLEDRKRALVSRMLQYMLIHRVLGVPYDEIVIRRTEEGKPYLAKKLEKQDFPNFNFNSSHHGDYVAIASEPLCLVGLDIMCHGIYERQPALEFLKNFSSCFTNSEWTTILSAGPKDEDVLNQFYRHWCLKEAYIKAVGVGLAFKLERLEFFYPAHQIWSDLAYLRIDGIKQKDWQFFLYQFGNHHWVCVARGPPNQAVSSYSKTLWQAEFDSESYNHGLELPNIPFALNEIQHLIPEHKIKDYTNTRTCSR